MGLSVVTPPTAYPVSLADAKLHLRVDGPDEDTLIGGYIAAANDYVEKYLGRSVATQTMLLTLDHFSDQIILPRGPVQLIASVVYDDLDGIEQTLPTSAYVFDGSGDPQWIVRASDAVYPETLAGINAVRITYVTGYAVVPPAIKQAMLLLLGDWYRMRENTAMGAQVLEMPHAVTALLANFRSFGF